MVSTITGSAWRDGVSSNLSCLFEWCTLSLPFHASWYSLQFMLTNVLWFNDNTVVITVAKADAVHIIMLPIMT